MNRILCVTICLFFSVILVACSINPNSAAIKSPVYPKSISFDDSESRRELRKANTIDEAYIKSLNNFSYRTIAKILYNQSNNVAYSPTSFYMALSLAAIGANGDTRDEIFSALDMNGREQDFLSKQSGNLFRILYSDNEVGKLKIANSLWLKKDMSYKEAFVSSAVQNYYSSVYRVDFADENTEKIMINWISDNTNGILSPRVNLDKDQIMSIINTIYLKDEWIDRFKEDNTKADIFRLSDGNEEECDFMNMTYRTHGFVKGDGFTSSSLSLKNSGSMIFILPDKGVSINYLLSTPEKVSMLFDGENRENGKVIFKIPKFSFRSDLNLNDTLKSMGVVSAFKHDANFKGMTDDIAFISNIKQQTHIAIDEKGVEAAAFTQIDYVGAAPPKEKVAEMILDRPFIFAIKSHHGSLLFVGIVNNPIDI